MPATFSLEPATTFFGSFFEVSVSVGRASAKNAGCAAFG